MKDTFERDAGLGWLSRFNGKPKILRDTVRCLHRKNLDTNTSKLLHRLSACFQDQSSAEMDLFEVETDIMKWTRPFGIPLRIGWHLSRYVHCVRARSARILIESLSHVTLRTSTIPLKSTILSLEALIGLTLERTFESYENSDTNAGTQHRDEFGVSG